MRVIFILCLCISLLGCTHRKATYRNADLPVDKRVELLLAEMTLEEKIGQMCQYTGNASLENQQQTENIDAKVEYTLGLGERADLIRQGKIGSFLKVPSYREANYLQALASESRLKIPLLIATDAIHGHGMYVPPATIYPTPIGIASSFDNELAKQIAHYTAREMRATGYHWTFSPNVDIVRDARWGRSGETFGEDPLLVSNMGLAMVQGYQGTDFSEPDQVLACAKHFAGGGIAYNGLNGAATDISERTLHEIFFPPFKELIDADVYTIMPAHNELNGIPCHAHREYLTDLIRGAWNFDGFYISDWLDIERLLEVHSMVEDHKKAAEVSVNSGLDMHMHGPGFFDDVLALVEENKIPVKRIDEAVRRILYAKFQLGLFENPYVDSTRIQEIILSDEHKQLALEAARKSIVLLKNDEKLLPLGEKTKSVFIAGPFADHQAILGDWSRPLPREHLITVVDGIRHVINEQTKINYLPCPEIDAIDNKLISNASKQAAISDVAILVLGENGIRFSPHKTIGENLDRQSLELSGRQLELAKAVINTGTPTIVVLVNGGPIASEWISENAAAILESWEPGMMGGRAIAEILFGKYNPGSRLPVTIPRSTGHIQSFYNHKPSSFHRGKFKDMPVTPLYEFGFGLSYTEFEYTQLEMPDTISPDNNLDINFAVRNTGAYDGDEVVLVFLNDKISSITTPVKKLVAYQRIHLKQGEQQQMQFNIENNQFSYLNHDLMPIIEPGEFEIFIGNNKLSKTIWIK